MALMSNFRVTSASQALALVLLQVGSDITANRSYPKTVSGVWSIKSESLPQTQKDNPPWPSAAVNPQKITKGWIREDQTRVWDHVSLSSSKLEILILLASLSALSCQPWCESFSLRSSVYSPHLGVWPDWLARERPLELCSLLVLFFVTFCHFVNFVNLRKNHFCAGLQVAPGLVCNLLKATIFVHLTTFCELSAKDLKIGLQSCQDLVSLPQDFVTLWLCDFVTWALGAILKKEAERLQFYSFALHIAHCRESNESASGQIPWMRRPRRMFCTWVTGFGHGRNESDERKYLRIHTNQVIRVIWVRAEWWSKDRDISWYFTWYSDSTSQSKTLALGTRCACHQRHCLLSRSSRSSSQTVRKFPRVHKQDGDVEEHAKDIYKIQRCGSLHISPDFVS